MDILLPVGIRGELFVHGCGVERRKYPVPSTQEPVEKAVLLQAFLFNAEYAACHGEAESEDGRDAEVKPKIRSD